MRTFAPLLLGLALLSGAAHAVNVGLSAGTIEATANATTYNPYGSSGTTRSGAPVSVTANRPAGGSTEVTGDYDIFAPPKYYARIYQSASANWAFGAISAAGAGFSSALSVQGTEEGYKATLFDFTPTGTESVGDPLLVTLTIRAEGRLRHYSEVNHVPNAGNGYATVQAYVAHAVNYAGDYGAMKATRIGDSMSVTDTGTTYQFYTINESVVFGANIGDILTLDWSNYLRAYVPDVALGIGNAMAYQTLFDIRVQAALAPTGDVPEPATALMLLAGGVAAFLVKRRIVA